MPNHSTNVPLEGTYSLALCMELSNLHAQYPAYTPNYLKRDEESAGHGLGHGTDESFHLESRRKSQGNTRTHWSAPSSQAGFHMSTINPNTMTEYHSLEGPMTATRSIATERRRRASGPPLSAPSRSPKARLSVPDIRSNKYLAESPSSIFIRPPSWSAYQRGLETQRQSHSGFQSGPTNTRIDLKEPEVQDVLSVSHNSDDSQFRKELDTKWILNVSMLYKERPDQEKYIITYAEKPNFWRRVTVTIDYSNAPEDSLEADLKTLHYQRDKSAHIYEAIRGSLPQVQFYDTVTNLKLKTADNRLHVHVCEDVNEIIEYPTKTATDHLAIPANKFVKESEVIFKSHLSGFVYRVSVNNQEYIKKEIPGPDMIDEFLYEINALYKLRHSRHVIDIEYVVVDEKCTTIRGVLIAFADRGALVDLIFDNRETLDIDWTRRLKWANQIVSGLGDIHEHGFVQGDFTLSNIVLDDNDDAKIIDINRRGCPVGWEPPEFRGLIRSGQRISMYIGVKSDLYQLGMVLWGLAEMEDEPERAEDLGFSQRSSRVPQYWKSWVRLCLSEDPAKRPSARDMLRMLDAETKITSSPLTPRLKSAKHSDCLRVSQAVHTEQNRVQQNGLQDFDAQAESQDNRNDNSCDAPYDMVDECTQRSSSAKLTGTSQTLDSYGQALKFRDVTHAIPSPSLGHVMSGLQQVQEPDSLEWSLEVGIMGHGQTALNRRVTRDPRGYRMPLHQDSGYAGQDDYQMRENHGVVGNPVASARQGVELTESNADADFKSETLDDLHNAASQRYPLAPYLQTRLDRLKLASPLRHIDSGFDEAIDDAVGTPSSSWKFSPKGQGFNELFGVGAAHGMQ